MTNEELDQARAEEAFEQSKADARFTEIAAHAARLAREGWTPPVAVDLDMVEGRRIFESKFYDNVIAQSNVSLGNLDDHPEMVRIFKAIKRGRELERAALQPKEDAV